MAAAQAQAVRQATISHTESLELVRCLLRVSIFHISYLRGLFPDDYFNGVDMRNLDGTNIKMLQPKCEESRRLIDWVESGVYDAVRRGYIKTLYFGIATDPEGVRLLEEYVFNFSYGQGANGAVTMDVAQHNMRTGAKSHINPAQGQKSGTDTVQAVKYQVTRLMRMLVQVCQTLDRVPQERFLFMRLTYHDNTPEEYEPPFFVPVEGAGEQGSGWGGYFARKPFTMVVGDVSTSHHGVTMKVKSTLDCCDEEGEEEGMHEPAQEEVADGGGDGTSQGGRTSCQNPAAKGCPGGKGDTASMVTDAGGGSKDVHEVQGKLRATAKQDAVKPAAVKTTSKGRTGTEPATVPTSLDVDPAQYKAVGMYVVQCFQNFSQLDLSDAMVAFTHIPMPQLEAIFERMEREDILTRQDVDAQAFRPGPKLLAGMAAQEQAAAAAAAADQLANKLAMGNKKGAKAVKGAVRGRGQRSGVPDVVGQRDQDNAELDASQQAQVVAEGSDITGTGSPVKGKHLPARPGSKAAAEAAAEAGGFFENAAQSGAKANGCNTNTSSKVRKASYVADPIHQSASTAKRTRRAHDVSTGRGGRT